MPNSFGYIKVTSKMILDKTIVDADVSDSANIAASKLNLSAINQNIVPDLDDVCILGGGSNRFFAIYVHNCVFDIMYRNLIPSGNNINTVGSDSVRYKEAYINKLFGDCISQIMILSLLGGQ